MSEDPTTQNPGDPTPDARCRKELAHVLLHDPGRATVTSVDCRGVVEVEAESVAYLVASSHGLATDSYSFAYVTGWAAAVPGSTPEDVVAATGQRVLSAARSILASTLDEPQATPDAAAALAERADAALLRSRAARSRAEAQPSHWETVPGRHQRERLLAVHADAQALFEERVLSSWVPAYVESRGLGGALDVSSPWRLGYAPTGWTELTRHLQDAGYSDDTLEASGLCIRARTGRLVDRFRDRLTLPIRDPEGRVIAFVGRTGPNSDPNAPRYLNSPETPLFTKGAVLFGTAEGRLAWQSGATPVLVEGPLDAIAVALATEGRYAGMALCGTALSCTQARTLADAAELGGRLVVALDADPAGRSATAKAFELLPKSGLRLEVAELPPGSDPAELLKTEGTVALNTALDRSRPLIDAVIDHELDAHAGRLQWAEGRVAAVRAVTPLIGSLAPLDAVRQVRRVAELTGLPVATVTNELLDNLARPEQATVPRARGPSSLRLPDPLSTPPRRAVPVVHRPRR